MNPNSRTKYDSRNFQTQETITLHTDPLVLDHRQFHVDQSTTLVLANVMAIENPALIELLHVEDTLNFTTIEKILDLPTTLPSKTIAIVFF